MLSHPVVVAGFGWGGGGRQGAGSDPPGGCRPGRVGGGKGMEVFGCCRHATRSSVYIYIYKGWRAIILYIYIIFMYIYIYIIGSRLLDKGTDC